MNTNTSRAFAFAPLALGLAAIALAQPTDPAAAPQDGPATAPTWPALQRVAPTAPTPHTPPAAPVAAPASSPGNFAGAVINSFSAAPATPGAVAVGSLRPAPQDGKALQELERLRSEIDVLRAERETMLRALEQAEPRNGRAPSSETGTDSSRGAGDQQVTRVTRRAPGRDYFVEGEGPEGDFFVRSATRPAPKVDFFVGRPARAGGSSNDAAAEYEVEVHVLDPNASTDPSALRAVQVWANDNRKLWNDASTGAQRTIYVVPTEPSETPPGVSGLHAPRWRVLEHLGDGEVQDLQGLIAPYLIEAERLAADGSSHADHAREQADQVRILVEELVGEHEQTLRIESEQANDGGTSSYSWIVVENPHTGEHQVNPGQARARILLSQDSDGQHYEFHVGEQHEEQAEARSRRASAAQADARATLELHLGDLENARVDLSRASELLADHELEAKLSELRDAEAQIELQLGELEGWIAPRAQELVIELQEGRRDARVELEECVELEEIEERAEAVEREQREIALHHERVTLDRLRGTEDLNRRLRNFDQEHAEALEHVEHARAEAQRAAERALQDHRRSLGEHERALAEQHRALAEHERALANQERSVAREHEHARDRERAMEREHDQLEREFDRRARELEREAERLDEHLIIELHESLRESETGEILELQLEQLQTHLEALENAHGELGNGKHALQNLVESLGGQFPHDAHWPHSVGIFDHEVFENGSFEFNGLEHLGEPGIFTWHTPDALPQSVPQPHPAPAPRPHTLPGMQTALPPGPHHIEDVEIQIHHHNAAGDDPAHDEMLNLLHEIRDELRAMRGEMRDLRSSVQGEGRVGALMRPHGESQDPDAPISALSPFSFGQGLFAPATTAVEPQTAVEPSSLNPFTWQVDPEAAPSAETDVWILGC